MEVNKKKKQNLLYQITMLTKWSMYKNNVGKKRKFFRNWRKQQIFSTICFFFFHFLSVDCPTYRQRIPPVCCFTFRSYSKDDAEIQPPANIHNHTDIFKVQTYENENIATLRLQSLFDLQYTQRYVRYKKKNV